MTDGTPDLASAARALVEAMEHQRDRAEEALVGNTPEAIRLAGRVLKAHKALRAALAAHDQQDEPDDDEPEQVQLAMVPLPGNGRYSVTVEHQADRGEDHYQTREWEVWAKDGNVRVEPMTYPEPGVSDTSEPRKCTHANGAGFYCDLPADHEGEHEGYWWNPHVGQTREQAREAARRVRGSATPEGGQPTPSTQRRVDVSDDDPSELRGVRLMQESIAQNEAAHRGQPTDDELLARADKFATEAVGTYMDPEGQLVRALAHGYKAISDDLAQAKDDVDSVRRRADHLADELRKADVRREQDRQKIADLRRERAEARSHGEVLLYGVATVMVDDGDALTVRVNATETTGRTLSAAEPGPVDVLVVRPVEDQEETDGK